MKVDWSQLKDWLALQNFQPEFTLIYVQNIPKIRASLKSVSLLMQTIGAASALVMLPAFDLQDVQIFSV